MKRKLFLILFLIAAILAVNACSSGGTKAIESASGEPQINPLSEAARGDTVLVNLYYGYTTEQLLVSEMREIDVPINERIEITILSNLIQGASNSKADFSSVINPATKVVNVTDNDGYLFVTLSKEFLLEPAEGKIENMNINIRRYLAAYSIVDTLIEQGGYTRVQILIDRDDSGAGTPITNAEIGLEGNDPTEPLGRNGSIILNSRNTMREIFSAIEMKDWSRLYGFISYKDREGNDRPTLDAFINEVAGKNIVLSDTKIVDHISSTDLYSDYVLTDYTIKLGDNEPQTKTNISIYLLRENDMWKMPYDILSNYFMNANA